MRLQEQLIHSQPIRPHPAHMALQRHPAIPSMILSCGMCGDEWAVPVNAHGEPDTDRYGQDILSCPACGTITQTIFSPPVHGGIKGGLFPETSHA